MKSLKSPALLLVGSLLTAASVNTFAVPNQLGEGGVPGLTMLFYYLFQIPTALSNLILNGLLLLIGLKILDKKILVNTLVVIVVNSLFLHVLAPYPFVFENAILAPLVAGFLMGAGIGLIYQGEGTAAGGTIIAKMLEIKTGLPKSKGILMTDLAVILPSGLVIGFERMCLTIISVYLGSKVIAFISEGAKPKKSVLIISPKVAEISANLATTIARNGTFFTGTGSFSKAPQKMLYVVVEASEILSLKKTIHQLDETAFVVVMDVQNVLGTHFSK